MAAGGARSAAELGRGWRVQRRCLGWVLAMAVGLAAANPAQAQLLRLIGNDGPSVEMLPPTGTEPGEGACLQVEEGQLPRPAVPVALRAQHFKGEVRVELRFSRGDRPPAFRVLEVSAPGGEGRQLAESVRSHARHLRLPCLSRGSAGLTLVRTYRFDHRGEYVLHALMDRHKDPRSRGARDCLTHISGATRPAESLAGLPGEGRMVLRARFVAPDQAPAVEAFHMPPAAPARDFARKWVGGLRVPCLEGDPIELTFAFQFRWEGQAFGLNDLTLPQLLRHARPRPDAQSWDTQAMACPFDLVLWYGQPQLPNIVLGLVSDHPARGAMLERLVGLELNLQPAQINAVFGSQVDVHVPCGSFVL